MSCELNTRRWPDGSSGGYGRDRAGVRGAQSVATIMQFRFHRVRDVFGEKSGLADSLMCVSPFLHFSPDAHDTHYDTCMHSRSLRCVPYDRTNVSRREPDQSGRGRNFRRDTRPNSMQRWTRTATQCNRTRRSRPHVCTCAARSRLLHTQVRNSHVRAPTRGIIAASSLNASSRRNARGSIRVARSSRTSQT